MWNNTSCEKRNWQWNWKKLSGWKSSRIPQVPLSDWSTSHGRWRLRDYFSKQHIHKYLGPGDVHLGVHEEVGCCNIEVHISSLKGHGIMGFSRQQEKGNVMPTFWKGKKGLVSPVSVPGKVMVYNLLDAHSSPMKDKRCLRATRMHYPGVNHAWPTRLPFMRRWLMENENGLGNERRVEDIILDFIEAFNMDSYSICVARIETYGHDSWTMVQKYHWAQSAVVFSLSFSWGLVMSDIL